MIGLCMVIAGHAFMVASVADDTQHDTCRGVSIVLMIIGTFLAGFGI
jgi:hypothetical protein